MKHEDIRTTHFRVTRPKEALKLKETIMSSLHFQNLLILLLDENYELFKKSKTQNLQKYLLNKRVMRAVVSGAKGGKNEDGVKLLLKNYQDHKIFENLLSVGKTLKEKNIAQLVGKLKAAYKSFYTKRKNGDKEAEPPSPQKLSKIKNFAIPIDQCAFSFAKKDFLRINLDKKMQSFHLNHSKLLKVVENLKNIQSLELMYKHEEIYFSLSYHKKLEPKTSSKDNLYAGLDLGVQNLASLLIADGQTPSLVVSGKKLIEFNNRNNIEIARRKSSEKILDNELKAIRKQKEQASYLSEQELLQDQNYVSLKSQWWEAKQLLAKSYRKRHHSFKDFFHKASVRILEFLSLQGVNVLFVSRNLGEAKQNKGFRKKFNKKFHQIPLLKLIDYIQLKGAEFGIEVEDIDEAYTSKSSCLSGDVCKAKDIAAEIKQGDPKLSRKARRQKLSNAFMGVRESRSLFFDKALGKRILADLNAACNHIKVGVKGIDFSWLKEKLWKLTRPVLVYPDSLFLDLTLTGVQSELRDPHRVSYAAKLRKNLFR